MKAPPFAYARASSLDDALERLAEAGPEAKLLAGGQSLVPLLAYRILRPSHLVDIDGLGELGGVARTDAGLEIGPLTRHAQLEHARLEGAERLLALAAARIGHVPIRARGTIGGSLAHADPAAELPVAVLALGAEIEARSAGGSRTIPAASFFAGPFTTALEPGEALTSVRIPAAARTGVAGFAEFATRPGDFALVAAAAVAAHANGHLAGVRIALGGVGATPVRAETAEAVLEGAAPTPETVREAAARAAADCDVADDPVASAAYRRRLVERLVRDAVERLA